ncbi:MAG: hypothetical protein WA667_23545 [Candidatus Nitrosopolaris sp.]
MKVLLQYADTVAAVGVSMKSWNDIHLSIKAFNKYIKGSRIQFYMQELSDLQQRIERKIAQIKTKWTSLARE